MTRKAIVLGSKLYMSTDFTSKDDERFFNDAGPFELKEWLAKLNKKGNSRRRSRVLPDPRNYDRGPFGCRGYYYEEDDELGEKDGYVLIVNGWQEGVLHQNYGYYTRRTSKILEHPDKINLVVFTGGADINPNIYNHKMHLLTHISPSRDKEDTEVFEAAKANGIPCVGICRGGQFLIAKAGGYLYQHTTGHIGGMHQVDTCDGKSFSVTSAHHQMFGLPLPKNSELVAWSTIRLSDTYEVGDGIAKLPEKEPECVWLPEINSLAVQWHPEWMKDREPGLLYYFEMINKYLGPIMNERKNKREHDVANISV